MLITLALITTVLIFLWAWYQVRRNTPAASLAHDVDRVATWTIAMIVILAVWFSVIVIWLST